MTQEKTEDKPKAKLDIVQGIRKPTELEKCLVNGNVSIRRKFPHRKKFHLTENSHHKENFHLTEGKDGAKAGGWAGCGQARPEAKVVKLAMMILMDKHNYDHT